MKSAVIYASSHGTSAKVSEMIASGLGEDNTVIFNLKENPEIDISQFDAIVLGGSIHAGMMQKKVKEFVAAKSDEILKKPFALFMVYMNDKDFEVQMEKAFPPRLRENAISARGVGGEFLMDQMNFFQRFIVRKISGHVESVSRIKTDEVALLISELKNKVG